MKNPITNSQAELIHQDGERLFITSPELAERFGKRHDDILKAIRNLECSGEFILRNFAEITYTDNRGRQQPMYEITRDGFAMLAMGFTGRRAMAWKEKYILAFSAMEAALRVAAPALSPARPSIKGRVERSLAKETPQEKAARLEGEITGLLRDENARLKFETARLRQALHEEGQKRERAMWARGPMGEEEFNEVRKCLTRGLTWTRIARDFSYRSPGALAAQYRRRSMRVHG